MGISTESNPQRLNLGKRRVLALVNGEVKRNVLIPKRMARGYGGPRDPVKGELFALPCRAAFLTDAPGAATAI